MRTMRGWYWPTRTAAMFGSSVWVFATSSFKRGERSRPSMSTTSRCGPSTVKKCLAGSTLSLSKVTRV